MLKMKRKLNAMIAIQIILTMTLYYFVFVGVTAVTYALDVVKTNHENIDISAYFINQNGEKVDKIEQNIDKEEFLYVEISVKNEGYFNGNISLSNNNFNIKQENSSPDIDEISGNIVKLKQINAGTTKTIKLGIEAKKEATIKVDDLNAKTSVELQGEYINSKNIEKNSYVEISGKTEVEVDWKSSEETKSELKGTLLTNNVYQINEESKRIVQFLIDSKITNNNYPVKNTEILLNVPDDVQDVKVHTRCTNATNKNVEFNENNYQYNKEEKTVTISLANENQENVSWEQNTEDEIVVTYILEADKDINNQEILLNSTIQTYDDKVLNESKIIKVDKEIDGVITSNLEAEEKSIYKGKIYTGEDRDYTTSTKINIDYLNTVEEIIIKGYSASYVENETTKTANIIYKQTEIDKNEFLEIFGGDGYITIKDNTETIIANINKETEANENGKIIVKYQNNVNEVTIQTSNPVNLGILNIKNTKTIKNANYTREEISNFTGIEETETVNDKNEKCELELKETSSEANIKLDTAKISTLADEQTLTIDATLLANDESKDLYKNPNVIITFPKELNITAVQYAALYKNGLDVEDITYYKNDNNQTEVNLQFNGEQTNYDILGGTRIRLKVSANTSKLTPSKMTEVQMKYTNENKNIENTVKAELKLESQYGLMLYNKLLGYNNSDESIETIDKEPVYGNLDINGNSMSSTLQTALINNYDEQIQNITLIGKIPSKGEEENTFSMNLRNIATNNNNVKIYYSDSLNDKQSDDVWNENSENAKMYKIIIPTMEPGEILAIKTNLEVPEKLEASEQGKLNIDVQYNINDTVQSNSSTIVLESNVNQTATVTSLGVMSSGEQTNPISEEGMEVNITSTIGNQVISNGSDIKEGQTIKYTIKIKNNTGKDYSNVKVKAVQKNGYVWDIVTKKMNVHTSATEYKEMDTKWFEITDSNEINLGTISTFKNGESYEVSYKSSTYLLDNSKIDGVNTYGTIYITSDDGLDKKFTTTENKIQSAKLKVDILNTINEDYTWTENGAYSTKVDIKNISDETLNNITVKTTLCKELSDSIDADKFNFENKFFGYKVDGDNETLNTDNVKFDKIEKNENGEAIISFKILKIESNDIQRITINLSANNITDKVLNAWLLAEVATEDNDEYSFKFEKEIYKDHRDISVNIKAYKNNTLIQEGTKLENDDIVDFIASITNNDEEDVNINIAYTLDETIDIQSIYLNNSSEDIKNKATGNDLEIENIELKSGETMQIKATAKIDGINANEIRNEIIVDDNITSTSVSNSIKFEVNTVSVKPDDEEDSENPNNPSDPNNPSNPDDTNNPSNPNDSNNKKQSYKISGVAWIDENKDGKRVSSEKIISSMQVSAINTKTNEVEASSKTDSNGKYELTLQEGNYIVIFYYDNEIYTTTTYKSNGLKDEENSDAIEKDIAIDGQNVKVAATDTITLNKNMPNIDVGLVIKGKFDLNIEKFVSKIIVKNDAETKIYEQKEGTTLAKAEIKTKNLKDSLVVIEYKIKVTNTGDVAGYAKNIEDTLPETLTFNSSINSDWYKSNSAIYNTSLANTLIKPGESKEVTLTLTKTMTESNTGLINNKAKIIESSNLKGIEDATDDTGSANVIISISTGALVNYIAIVCIIFAIATITAFGFIFFLKDRI